MGRALPRFSLGSYTLHATPLHRGPPGVSMRQKEGTPEERWGAPGAAQWGEGSGQAEGRGWQAAEGEGGEHGALHSTAAAAAFPLKSVLLPCSSLPLLPCSSLPSLALFLSPSLALFLSPLSCPVPLSPLLPCSLSPLSCPVPLSLSCPVPLSLSCVRRIKQTPVKLSARDG